MNSGQVIQYKSKFILFAVFILYFVSRFLFVDADIAPWHISSYQSIDEFYYSLGSFNLFHYNDYDFSHFSFLDEPKFITGYFHETLVAISLKLFGNNYYGFRAASVFCGGAVIYLSYLLGSDYLAEINKPHKREVFPLYVLLAYFLFDFSFLQSNRIVEPTLFRMLAFMIVFYISLSMTKSGINKKTSFILGFISAASVLFVYTTNLFIIPAVGIYIILISGFDNLKKNFKNIFLFTLGVVFSAIAFFAFYYLVFNSSFLTDYMFVSDVFKTRVTNTGKVMVYNAWNIINGNIFKYNYSLLFLFVFSIPLFLFVSLSGKSRLEKFLLSSGLMLFLQSLFINDYPERKMLIWLPIVLFVIFVAYNRKDEIVNYLNRYVSYKYSLNIFFVFSLLVPIVLHWKVGGSEQLINFIILFLVAALLFIIINKNNLLISKAFLGILFFVLFFLNGLLMNYSYIYSNPEFKYRDAMISIAPLVDDKYTVGWGHAFRLYNSSKPVMSAYTYAYWSNNFEDHRDLILSKEGDLLEFLIVDGKKRMPDSYNLKLDINEVSGNTIELKNYSAIE